MKNVLYFLILLTGWSCNQSAADAQSKLNPSAFEAKLTADSTIQLVDVRTPEEYASGHIDGARLINFHDADFAAQIGKLDKTKPVMVYCAAGGRSGSAAKQLSKMGFTNVFDLAGGMGAWKAEGKKTVQ